MNKSLQIFVGWDAMETVAYHVLEHSIITRASRPVSITPVARRHLRGWYDRERGPLDSTDFSNSRWAVPYLHDYEQDYVLWMDPDMLCLTDIRDILIPVAKDPHRAVWVVKHDYVPRHSTKMEGAVQTKYPRKNWSSFMVMDPAKCQALSRDYIHTAPGLDLHGFAWLPDEEIGELPNVWNHLVDEENQCRSEDALVLHYTGGGPWLAGCEDVPLADQWRQERDAMVGQLVPSGR